MQQENERIRLNLGCGLLTSPGWVNVDGSWNARLAKHPALRRALSGGGLLRIVVPDLNAIVREYLGERPFGPLSADMEALRPADRFNQRLLMRSPAHTSANLFYRV
jgi:predicted SAM-dependent methyltransferase